jgi:hypothetical protein
MGDDLVAQVARLAGRRRVGNRAAALAEWRELMA